MNEGTAGRDWGRAQRGVEGRGGGSQGPSTALPPRTLALPLRLGMGERAYLEGDEALMQRVQLVLATPPGSLPWREDFGCGIWSLLGQPATPQKLGEARWKVEEALARWVPEAELQSCEVTLLPGRDPQGLRALLRSPLESGLLHLGVDAVLQLELTLRTREGVLRARLELLEALP